METLHISVNNQRSSTKLLVLGASGRLHSRTVIAGTSPGSDMLDSTRSGSGDLSKRNKILGDIRYENFNRNSGLCKIDLISLVIIGFR